MGLFILVFSTRGVIDFISDLQDCYNSWRMSNEVRI
jgi:hypothetical protein